MPYKRNVIKALTLAVMTSGLSLCGAQDTTISQEQYSKARKEAAQRNRPIIVNDDGMNKFLEVNKNAGTVDGLLRWRFYPAREHGIGTYFYNTAIEATNLVHMTVGLPNGDEVIVNAAHEAGMEIFATLRMNDTHDALVKGGPKHPLKKAKPYLLLGWDEEAKQLGDQAYWSAHGGWVLSETWTGFNYACPEVCQFRLADIERLCKNSDYDGIDLDFFRVPLYFKIGEGHKQENRDIMTQLVRDIRQLIDRYGRARGRPYLLSARFPETPAQALSIGLDVEAWLREDLLDFFEFGEENQMTGPHAEFIELGHRFGVQVYPCLGRWTHKETMRATASNFFAAGADGVFMFNYSPDGSSHASCPWWSDLRPDEPFQMARIKDFAHELGSVTSLRGLDKLFEVDYGQISSAYTMPSARHQVPVRLSEWAPLRLVVGDDIEAASQAGELEKMRLQVRVGGIDTTERVTIWVHGVPIDAPQGIPSPAGQITGSVRLAQDGCWFDVPVTAPPLRNGTNEIVVMPGANSGGPALATVDHLQLWVDYKDK